MASNPAEIMAAGQALVPDTVTQDLQHRMANLQIQGAAIQNQAQAQQLRMQQTAMQRQQAFGADMQHYIANPSAEGVARIFSYPEFAAPAKEAYMAMDEQRRRSDTTQIGSAASLAAKGDYTGAANLIQSRIAADKAAGHDSSTDQAMYDHLTSGDPAQQKAALAMMTLALGAAVGPEHAADFLKANGFDRAPVVMKPGDVLQDPQGGAPIASVPQPLSVSSVELPGGTKYPVAVNVQTGQVGPQGTAAPAPAGAATPPGTQAGAPTGSRADRNNNPGNLRAINPKTVQPVSWVTSLPGYQGADAQGYAIFAPGTATGTSAQQALLGRYFKAGRNTVSSIVEHWAPRQSAGGDNTDAQVNNYTAYVAQQLGVDPNKPLPMSAIPQIAAAMHQFEAGATGHAGAVRVPQGGAGAPVPQNAPGGPPAAPGGPSGIPSQLDPSTGLPIGGTAPLNTQGAPAGYAWNPQHTGVAPVPGGEQDLSSYPPAMVHDAAVELLTTGQMPSMGMGGAAIKKAILDERSKIMQAARITADQLPTFRARYGADKTALQNISGIANGLQASESALTANLHQVQTTQQQLVNDGLIGDTPLLNRGRLAWARQFGTAAQKAHVKAYEDALNGGQTEYAKFMSTQTGMGNAPTTDSARNRAGDLLDEEDAPAATLAGIHQLRIEASNKKNGVLQQRSALEQKLSSYLQPQGQNNAPAQTAPPGGKLIGHTRDGRPVYQLPNGHKVAPQ